MKHLFIHIVLLASVLTASATCEWKTKFSYQTWNTNGATMRYRLAEINVTANENAADIVLFLHGGSARGCDNEAQMTDEVGDIYNYLLTSGRRALFILPQCDSCYADWMVQEVQGQLKTLLDHYIADGRTANGRVFVLGSSMGALGAMAMLNNYPGLFTAAMPVAFSSASRWDVCRVAHTPLVVVRGSADHANAHTAMEDFFNAVRGAGGVVSYELVDGWGHGQTCRNAFTSERLALLFSMCKEK